MQQLGNIHQVKAIVIVMMILGMSPAVNASKALRLDKLKMPEGFTISIFAEVDNPRQLAIDNAGSAPSELLISSPEDPPADDAARAWLVVPDPGEKLFFDVLSH